mmetsp:Transcript_51777/g.116248  ORF Transcript_51777/g.116248 Transcript_51777/m.116248 type:complete len:86 (-) Transcript_51777:106-363(-)
MACAVTGSETKLLAQRQARASQRRSDGHRHLPLLVKPAAIEGSTNSGCLWSLKMGSWLSFGRGCPPIGQISFQLLTPAALPMCPV